MSALPALPSSVAKQGGPCRCKCSSTDLFQVSYTIMTWYNFTLVQQCLVEEPRSLWQGQVNKLTKPTSSVFRYPQQTATFERLNVTCTTCSLKKQMETPTACIFIRHKLVICNSRHNPIIASHWPPRSDLCQPNFRSRFCPHIWGIVYIAPTQNAIAHILHFKAFGATNPHEVILYMPLGTFLANFSRVLFTDFRCILKNIFLILKRYTLTFRIWPPRKSKPWLATF